VASYLRGLLERQPACLIRVQTDGVILACNDAALSLFGVASLGAILNTNLTDRLVASERSKWQEFSPRVWAKGAASLACHLAPSDDGDPRPVLLQAIALNDHPDGIDSLLVNLRDQSHTHQLEHAIQSAELSRVDQEERQRAARDQIEVAGAERRRLEALVDDHQAECRLLAEELAAQTADHKQREAKFVELENRVEKSQLALLTKDREHRTRIASLEAALAAAQASAVARPAAGGKQPVAAGPQDAASGGGDRREIADFELRLKASTAEQARLRALLGDYENRQRRMTVEHQSAIETLEQSLAAAAEEAKISQDQAHQALADSRAQLAQVLAEQGRLASRSDEYERERAAHQKAMADLETSMREALAGLRAQLALALDEQSRLAARAEEHAGEEDRANSEHEQAIADLETRKREALAHLRSQLTQALTERTRLAARAEEEHERELDRIMAEHQQAVAALEASKREALADLRSKLAQVLAEHARLAARSEEEHESERERITAEQQRAIADLEASKREIVTKLRAQLWETSSEARRLAARVEEHERERELAAMEQDRAIAAMESSKREALAELRTRLSQASSAEQGRLTARITELEQERDGMMAEHRQHIADMQANKAEALGECERLLTEIQHAFVMRDGFGAEIQHRMVDKIDTATQQEARQDRLERLQAELTAAVSDMQAVLAGDGPQEHLAAKDRGRLLKTSDTATLPGDIDK
jgi:hypothetical protein